MKLDKTVVFCFRHYGAIKRAVYEKRYDPATEKQGGGGHAFVSDPTANKAMRNAGEIEKVAVPIGGGDSFLLRYPERWLRVVEKTRAHYGNFQQGELIALLYDECMQQQEICPTMKISRATYFNFVNDIVCFASGVAAGLNII